MSQKIAAALTALLLASAARADLIELNSGKEMKGLITRESASEIDVDIGYGTVTLNKADIRSIKRAGGKSRDALVKAKRLQDLVDGDAVTEDQAPLVNAYKKANQAREDLHDARARQEDAQDDEAGNDSELNDLISENKRAAQELSTANRDADPAYYNRLVSEYNSSGAAIRAKQLAMVERHAADSGLSEKIRDYMSAYQDFAREFHSFPKPEADAAKDDREFYGLMKGALAGMDRDFAREKVDAERVNGHWIVDVLLDGKVTARMIVDTGASVLALSRAIADQLGSEAVKRGTGQVEVADGRKVNVPVLELPVVEVGRNKVEHVLAGVMPDAPAPGIDGLLGMSFLNHFGFESDPKSGSLYLRRLR